jgi:hypothetical protein
MDSDKPGEKWTQFYIQLRQMSELKTMWSPSRPMLTSCFEIAMPYDITVIK